MMGINLQYTYGRKIRDEMTRHGNRWTIHRRGDAWYSYRDIMLDEVRKICPYDVVLIYPSFRIHETTLEATWCTENLCGRFYGLIEKRNKQGMTDWVFCFETEEDAMAFKLRWL